MKETVTYDQIHPLVQYVEIASDVVQCHFHCPVKSKKIVAITRLTRFGDRAQHVPVPGTIGRIKASALNQYKKYFGRYEEPTEVEDPEVDKENAIVHAFGKISERFVWSETHKHFIYKF